MNIATVLWPVSFMPTLVGTPELVMSVGSVADAVRANVRHTSDLEHTLPAAIVFAMS